MYKMHSNEVMVVGEEDSGHDGEVGGKGGASSGACCFIKNDLRSKENKKFQFGLNGTNKFCAKNVYSIQLKESVSFDIPEPCDWTPGFFWIVRVYFDSSSSTDSSSSSSASTLVSTSDNIAPTTRDYDKFIVYEKVKNGATQLFLTKVRNEDLTEKERKENDTKYSNNAILKIEILEHRQHSMVCIFFFFLFFLFLFLFLILITDIFFQLHFLTFDASHRQKFNNIV
jgi:hypothetical protein